MENKVSDNVIEKNYRECLKFNEINESNVYNFDLATAKAALENLYELYKNGISTGRFTKDKDYVVRCADLVTLAEENKDSLFYDAWRIWFRYFEDTRGTLFYEYARLVKEIQPKVFIYENVKAILSNDDGRTWETMKEVFSTLGYKVYYTFNGKPSVLNARDYGIPQNRERMFVVGFRGDIELEQEFEFPKPIPLEKKMQDFLLDNVSGAYYLPKKGVEFVTSEKNLTKRYTQIDGEVALCQKKNQQFNWHGDFVFVEENNDMEKTMEDLEKYFLSEKVEKYVMATGTKNFYSRPKTDLEVARPLLTTMHKMHRAGVDNYVHTNGRLRKLTPRECLRLMGFCDSFKIVVSDTAMYQQAGNSIVVDVLIAIMKQIIKSIGNGFC